MEKILYKEQSYEIVSPAIKVFLTLGHGFLEKVYENALAIELRKRGFEIRQQHPVKVKYEGETIGEYFADLLVDGCILLELKTQDGIADANAAQTLNYLKATGLRLGIILNFFPSGLQHKRFVL